jgi:hypothetical protein
MRRERVGLQRCILKLLHIMMSKSIVINDMIYELG